LPEQSENVYENKGPMWYVLPSHGADLPVSMQAKKVVEK
jgi:hypothetical protein